MTADKLADKQGCKVIQVKCGMKNRLGTRLAAASAEIELPKGKNAIDGRAEKPSEGE